MGKKTAFLNCKIQYIKNNIFPSTKKGTKRLKIDMEGTKATEIYGKRQANNKSALTPILSSNTKPLKIFFNIKITYDFPELNK